MNIWLTAATVTLFTLVPCGILVFKGNLQVRLAGLEMAGLIESLLLILLAEAFHRPSFFDLAVAMALLSFGGGLVFARFLERWL